jgi:hypothetical protein
MIASSEVQMLVCEDRVSPYQLNKQLEEFGSI